MDFFARPFDLERKYHFPGSRRVCNSVTFQFETAKAKALAGGFRKQYEAADGDQLKNSEHENYTKIQAFLGFHCVVGTEIIVVMKVLKQTKAFSKLA